MIAMAAPVDQDDLDDQIARLKPNLLGFARSLARDHAEAEDLVQETFSRALGARHRFEPGTNLRAWLFTILRNLHLNRRRDAAAHPHIVGLEELVADRAADRRVTDVEEQVLARATLEQVAGAFRALPPEFAAPLHLVTVEDMSYAQVASLLDIPIGTVMSRVHRGRRLLIARLGEVER